MSKYRPTAYAAVLGAFGVFLLIRLLAWLYRSQARAVMDGTVVYGDAYLYYVPAGITYVHGSLPDVSVWQTNPEHPLLAKYVIGIFAVFLHNPNFASLLFGLLSAVVVFLLARKVVGSDTWASVAVLLLAFDGINVMLSIDPMLDIFMLFFGLLGLYLLLEERGSWMLVTSGFVFGLAIASKWLGALFLLAGMIWLLLARKLKPVAIILTSAVAAYLLSYLPFILFRGFGDFVSLQLWMVNYWINRETGIYSLITPLNRVFGPFFFISTLNPLFSPFAQVGPYYVSFDLAANPVTALLPYPVLYLQLRRGIRDMGLKLVLLAAGLFVTLHMFALDPFESWLFAPATALITIPAANLISQDLRKLRRERKKG